jgi:hypothetical protein
MYKEIGRWINVHFDIFFLPLALDWLVALRSVGGFSLTPSLSQLFVFILIDY